MPYYNGDALANDWARVLQFSGNGGKGDIWFGRPLDSVFFMTPGLFPGIFPTGRRLVIVIVVDVGVWDPSVLVL